MLDDFQYLASWYHQHCDGEREHSYGIAIDTLDNPGWKICIDLQDTPLEGRTLSPPVKVEESEERWLHVHVENQRFVAFCGPESLPRALEVFRQWSSQASDST